jgi:fluoride exporter
MSFHSKISSAKERELLTEIKYTLSKMVLDFCLVAAFGALGSVARYASTLLGRAVFSKSAIPAATLLINLLGCLLIGIFVSLFRDRLPEQRHLFLAGSVGFLGSYTTFSTFSLETLELVQSGHPVWAGLYVVLSVGAGVAGVLLGRMIAGGVT